MSERTKIDPQGALWSSIVASTGMPLSMQIVGRPFDEPTVFKVGDAYQRMTDWHLREPTPVWEAQPA